MLGDYDMTFAIKNLKIHTNNQKDTSRDVMV